MEEYTVRYSVLVVMICLGSVGFSEPSRAQPNVNYGTVENPYLFLLREPAIHAELKLSATQQETVEKTNAVYDAKLLAMRMAKADQVKSELQRIFSATQQAMQKTLTAEQRLRLGQIMLQMQGVACLKIDKVAEQLALSSQQRDAIGRQLDEVRSIQTEFRQRLQNNSDAKTLQDEYGRKFQQAQQQVLQQLGSPQQRQLRQLLGATFDTTRLGHVKLRTPDIVDTGAWINSAALRLEDLRGQVVVLHFWTYG
jgi:hypothetical protein